MNEHSAFTQGLGKDKGKSPTPLEHWQKLYCTPWRAYSTSNMRVCINQLSTDEFHNKTDEFMYSDEFYDLLINFVCLHVFCGKII